MPDIAPVVAVIQARMSSSRLPGKVLMPIAGKPLLWHLVHRLRKCRRVDQVAIATSTEASDDAIAEFCREEDVICVRGSLNNVLDRYRLAAGQTGARTLLRVTGDSPLIDPDFVDYLVAGLADTNSDFVQLEAGSLCAHEGVDVFSRAALDWLTTKAADDPVAREHVTSYFKKHPGVIRTAILPDYQPLACGHTRLSVDTVDDLAFIRAVHDRLQAVAGELPLVDVLALLREEPALRQINAHVRQKPMTQQERHALICCQGGSSAGLGHVRRSLSLARALRDEQGFGVTIAVKGEDSVLQLVRDAAFEAAPWDSPSTLLALAKSRAFRLAVVDVKDALTREDVAALNQTIPSVAVIDDISDRRLAATHAYYPPAPQVRELPWQGSQCRPHIGWDWYVLGIDPRRGTAARAQGGPIRVLVSMGGADPWNLTPVALEALSGLGQDVQADFVIGPSFADPDALARRIEKAGAHFHARRNVSDLAPLFAGADLAIIAFGVTAYELAALGVPALYLPISADHALAASALVAAGLGVLLPENAPSAAIAAAAAGLINDDGRRQAMRAAGPKLLDGQGASRIAADLANALISRSST